MPEYLDLYVLSDRRDTASIESFLGTFAAAREIQGDAFPVPMLDDDSTVVFDSVDSLIEHCCADIAEPYSLYWRVRDDPQIAFAMVFFLEDGHVVFGLSTPVDDKTSVLALLDRLGSGVGSREALVRGEQPPPETATAFRAELPFDWS